jgi:hypothetical protein
MGFSLQCTYYVGVVWVCASHVSLQQGEGGEGLAAVAGDVGMVSRPAAQQGGGQRSSLPQR